MGTLAMQAEDWAKAIAWFDEALAITPAFADALWLKGRAAEQSGDLAGARRSYEALIKRAPRSVNGYLDLAALEARLKHTDARRRVLLQGLNALPGHPALQQALQAPPQP